MAERLGPTPRTAASSSDSASATSRSTATQMERGVGPSSLSDRLLESVSLMGTLARCRESLGAFPKAGVDLPILVPPIGLDSARAVIQAFRR